VLIALFRTTGARRSCAPAAWPDGSGSPTPAAASARTSARPSRTPWALFDLDASVPWLVALQGWGVDDCERCADVCERAGVDLAAQSLVGLGSVCFPGKHSCRRWSRCRRRHTLPNRTAAAGRL